MIFLQTLSEILTAGVAITAFSLLLYALAFNLRDRVARSFAVIMACVVITSTAEAIGSTQTTLEAVNFWIRVQWVGVIFLPAAYLHFSDAVLTLTGRPSRGKRRWAIRLSYAGAVLFLFGLPFSFLLRSGLNTLGQTTYLQPTLITDLFMAVYVVAVILSWFNFIRAYRRTTTPTSRRRIFYLIFCSLAPALSCFPFLPYAPNFSVQHPILFWSGAVLVNLISGVLLVVMAYVVAFFGVSWPDRVVKVRLFKWIMRGPFTASVTLGLVTIIRRIGESFGVPYTALVPITMVACILLCEYLITIFSRVGQRWLFSGMARDDLDKIRTLQDQLLARDDLSQFLEAILATVSDRLQAQGAYIVGLNADGMELMVTIGKVKLREASPSAQGGAANAVLESATMVNDELLQRIAENDSVEHFQWGQDALFPLMNGTPEKPVLIGLLGVTNASSLSFDVEQHQAMRILVDRAAMALRDWRVQQKVFDSLESLSSQVSFIQKLRAAGQYDRMGALADEDHLQPESDLSNWVRDALTHYWGGPKLTENPLMNLKVVQDALNEHDGNHANALRAILRSAIDRVKPEGERRFTGEWILYNILEMKFLEGKKVREVALRLAMSEADLYRKQRVAIETIARVINEMEAQARKG